MVLWNDSEGTDGDIPFFAEGQGQPPGRSIVSLSGMWYALDSLPALRAHLSSLSYDFSRVEAVVLDEPFWNVSGATDPRNPCYTKEDGRYAAIESAHNNLKAFAKLLRKAAPTTRLWVNFSEPEIRWGMDTTCAPPLNGDFVDVVSVDKYFVPFDNEVRDYYSWIISHRATPWQQMALVPGTFYYANPKTGLPMTTTLDQQISFLQGYYDYANKLNTSCSLPVPPPPSPLASDGCPIWMVAGWTAISMPARPDSLSPVFFGTKAPVAQRIRANWVAELAKPKSTKCLVALKGRLARRRTRIAARA